MRALKGGLDAWEKHGYPVEPLPVDFDASRYTVKPELEMDGEYTVRARLSDTCFGGPWTFIVAMPECNLINSLKLK